MWTWICARPGGICDSGASSLKNPCVRVVIKSSQMLCRLRTVNSIPPFGGSATSWWTEVCDYRRHIHCPILVWLSLRPLRQLWLRCHLIVLIFPNIGIPRRPVVGGIDSSASGTPPGG
ncbi:hypothetical protein T10_1426 [Trichinella papuae]|uniref:Uncharacterized protein n=1 Tax=Trichinella papuae TaxID=268474 RepID=A0A0V1N6X7_9BILA|nr:hypothetical protein T10_1426 [Trichinella papuae]